MPTFPADGATGIPIAGQSLTFEALTTVRFGTTNPPPIVATGLALSLDTYVLPTPLLNSTTYYWAIERQGMPGVVRSFTTVAGVPVDCVLSAWSAWGPCINGQQTRTRTIVTPPANGGAACGPLSESQPCSPPNPPVDCVLSAWSAWSACVNNLQTRTRTIITPPSNGGAACGPLSETQACSPPNPPVDCVLSAWSAWGPCINNQETRTRTIVTPPSNGGAACGPLLETRACVTPPAGLVQASDCVFLGGFQPPDAWRYIGRGMALTATGTMLLPGQDTFKNVGEITIPATLGTGSVLTLPKATTVQALANVTGGLINQIANAALGGLLVEGNQVILTGYDTYGVSTQPTASHFIARLDFLNPQPTGPHKVSNPFGSPQFVNGHMCKVPPQWQSALGGPWLTGNSNMSGISNSSRGPTVTSFDPSLLTQPGGAPGIGLLAYPNAHPTHQQTLSDKQTGVVIIDDSILFIGRKGSDQRQAHPPVTATLSTPDCYGHGVSNPALHGTGNAADLNCYDPLWASKGQHAWPYFAGWVWAYKLSDLALVRAGSKQAWDIFPYAQWALPIPAGWSINSDTRGACFDPVTRRLYISVYAASGGRFAIVVFTIS